VEFFLHYHQGAGRRIATESLVPAFHFVPCSGATGNLKRHISWLIAHKWEVETPEFEDWNFAKDDAYRIYGLVLVSSSSPPRTSIVIAPKRGGILREIRPISWDACET